MNEEDCIETETCVVCKEDIELRFGSRLVANEGQDIVVQKLNPRNGPSDEREAWYHGDCFRLTGGIMRNHEEKIRDMEMKSNE